MKNRVYKILFLVAAIFVLTTVARVNPVGEYLLSLAYHETVTPKDLKSRYDNKHFKILIVPGHDNQYSGAEFRGLRETDLNLLIAGELYKLLSVDKHFKVGIARDLVLGNYSDDLGEFFKKEGDRISEFREQKKSIFERFLKSGEVESRIVVHHNFARPEVAQKLSGINLWANENDIDLTLHIHVNDLAGRRPGKVGEHYGFSIYVPERQYPNSRASAALADSIAQALQSSMQISTLPKESAGVIEDQELIAVGSYATREGAAVLVEYGYIYEPRWINPVDRERSAQELALQTYRGLIDYFEADKVTSGN